MIKHTKDYSLLIDSYMVRQFLTPGITGWAQVNGFRGETKETVAMLKRVEADLWYMENWSLMLDLKIIFLTIWVVVWGSDKAY
jgi:putative colanic acid biosysnthesis UDP-glucose lipid carrier transferase